MWDSVGGWDSIKQAMMFMAPAVGVSVLAMLYVWLFVRDEPRRRAGFRPPRS
jgi:hypothetical protein